MSVTKKRTRKSVTKKRTDIQELVLTSDPRRQAFAVAYYDQSSDTYGNGLQSAIKAGFTEEYAKTVLYKKPKWWSEIVSKMDLLDDLKNNLKYHVNLNPMVQAMGAFGPLYEGKGADKKPVMVESNVRLKLRQDITMWALEKLHPEFKKSSKDDPTPTKVEIKQVIILNPNGQPNAYNSATAEAVRSIPEAS